MQSSSTERIFTALLQTEGKVQNITNVKKGIDLIIKFRNQVPEQFRGFVDPTIKGGLNKLGKVKGKEIEDYIANGLK